jgi:hypothetical protein
MRKKGFNMIWNSFIGARLRSTFVLLALILACGEIGRSQPVLTKIQDVVYLADGSRFNGLALIDWKSFDTPSGAVIGRNSKVVRIVDGVLQTQLAPTTDKNNTYYSVKFSSGGRVLFTEIWAVSPSTGILKLRDVRAILLPGGFVSAPSNVGGGNSGGDGGGIIGENGTGAFVDLETPTGSVNGSNLIFTLVSTPSPGSSLELFRNGIRLSPSVDFTLTGNTITFVSGAQPQTGDILRASYRTGIFGTSPHNLLSSLHTDTVAENVQRGDLVVGQGSTTRWMRLPLGAANRCLTSNGLDAVWNTCLFTGFTAGAVPFVNSSSVLTQDAASFFWDATNRRLGLGTNTPGATLAVRAAPSQTTDLTSWANSSGTILARVTSSGILSVAKMNVSSTATQAALNDSGISPDPSSLVNGDFWYNSSQRARKSYEALQVHAFPQVICSVGGGSTSSTSSTIVGSCSIPTQLLDSGDRLEISLNLEHSGAASAFTTEIRIGSTSVFSRAFAATDTLAFVKASAGYFPTGTSIGTFSFGTAGTSPGSPFSGLSGNATLTPTDAVQLQFRAFLNSASADVVTLRNFTVVRYPAQFNP